MGGHPVLRPYAGCAKATASEAARRAERRLTNGHRPPRCRRNQSRARTATRSRAPGFADRVCSRQLAASELAALLELLVQDPSAACRDCAERHLLVTRNAELAHPT